MNGVCKMPGFDVIAFDGDDTLWHTEYLYAEAQAKFKQLLAGYLPGEGIEDRLYETEIRNLQQFGYGIKGFALTLIESAIELTEGRITGSEIQTLLDLAKEMLAAEVQLLDNVEDTLAELAKSNTLMLITKGDLFDQEAKIARSGVASYFQYIEIVSSKRPETYRALLTKYQVSPSRFLMVGNSPRSDILPVLEIGGHAVYIPHPITWSHEVADLPPADHQGYFELEHFGQLPDLLARLGDA
jgi:putative hydrolase of the HAD superfamily